MGVKRQKVAFFLPKISLSGGTERSCISVANELVKKGNVDVYIVTCEDSSKDSFFVIDSNVKIIYLDILNFRHEFLKLTRKLISVIKKNDFDFFVSVETYNVLLTFIALLFVKLRGNVKFIAWEHFNFTVNLGRKERKLARRLAQMVCDKIVVLTERDKLLWKKRFFKNSKIYVINNLSPYTVSSEEYCVDSKDIIAVGRLCYQKGFDILIDIWASLNNEISLKDTQWKLNIFGTGEDYEALQKQIKFLGVEESVILHGNSTNIGSHYSNSSFLVMTSRFEGLPMTLIEAQSFGLPIVAYDCVTGPGEVINCSNGFLVKEGVKEDFLSSLKEIMNDTELRKKFSVNAKKDVIRFSPNSIVTKWELLFNSL